MPAGAENGWSRFLYLDMVASHLHYEARRTPSFLAGLIDRRARADGQVQRLTDMLNDIHAELAQALEHRDACDALLKSYHAGLELAGIRPIRGFMGRYGKRGTIADAIRRFVADAGARGVTTSEIGAHLMAVLGLEFNTPQARKKWMQNSVAVRLRELKAVGEVEPMHDAAVELGKVGRWRLKTTTVSSVSSLLATANTCGVEVIVTDEDLPS